MTIRVALAGAGAFGIKHHADQTIACLDVGMHVQVVIPLADNLADALAVVAKQEETDLDVPTVITDWANAQLS